MEIHYFESIGSPSGFNKTEIEIMISLNDRNFTSDLNDNTSVAYMEVSNDIVNAVSIFILRPT